MRLFILILLCSWVAIQPSKADDKKEIATMSVRMFHDICMGSVINPDRLSKLLANFKELPDDVAGVFRENLEAGPESKVWGFHFTKANFVAVIDPEGGDCQFVGDQQLRYEDVEAEFKQAMKGFANVEEMEISPVKMNKTDVMNSLQYEYRLPANNISFHVFASTKNGELAPGQMGLIYTMRVQEIKS